jgi:orotidine 5'-phosphate decarboxylase subfamily 1
MFQRPKKPMPTPSTLSYSERAALAKNALARDLFLLMETKKTNLSVAADVKTKKELLDLARNLGPYICVLKTHIDIIDDFDADLLLQLKALAEEFNFIIFEDRKFADIGATAKAQYENGIFKIADWARITNAHTVPGDGIIAGLKEAGLPRKNGLLLLAEMSSAGNLATGEYTAESIKMAQKHTDFVIGFITMRTLSENQAFINFTPGINLVSAGDSLGQQYNTPDRAFAAGTDVQIIGRGIIAKNTPEEQIEAAKEYQAAGWQAYQNRITVQSEYKSEMSPN